MTARECSRLWQIDAYREGRLGAKDEESLERHLRACEACSAKMESDEGLRARMLALGAEEPNELALHRLRARVLRDAANGVPAPSSAWRGAAALVALTAACAMVLALVMHHRELGTPRLAASPARSEASPPPPAEPFAGTVVGEADARWWQRREQRQERVELDEGTVHVHVRPQQAGERFLVVMPDGEVEVRGTTFDVTVRGGETTRVRVESGVVDLRLRTRAGVRLLDGDVWTAPPVVSDSPPKASPPPAPPRVRPASPVGVDDGASSYAAAMQRLRDGRYEEAAAAFHGYVTAWPLSSQAEDASFLEAVALARAGRLDAAGLAAEHHLASFPRSFHAKEAAVLVERAAELRRPQNP